ncbi:DUF2637 domain-containing protein [Dactylosporangium sp. AC04546]|uniref:DUF2637 domain-containing protein n=1 Tax=Dactylosporangium sp. AC04546 TaxID=2862460 RepID=UPI001EDD6C38|nr:DUF2637 domain-containing protein [Dactylosporangium sp. AC04546]WVK82016.1 DUF2637 domain-containing protein [Dactylosporangium sp. AC04546]
MQSGRVWAYVGAILGGAASIAANVAHSFIAPAGAPQDWAPEIGAVISALFWPVFLFVAVEILTRVAWPRGWYWHVVRWLGLVPVSGVAALVSYRHLSGLLAHYGEDAIVAYVGPIAVDGLMVMATAALLATASHSPKPGDQPAPTGLATVSPLTVPVTATSSASATTSTHDTTNEPTPIAVPVAAAVDRPASELSLSTHDRNPAAPAPAPVALALTERPVPPTPAELAARITPRSTPAPAPSVTGPAGAADAAAAHEHSGTTPADRLAPSADRVHATRPDAAQLALPLVDPDLLTRASDIAERYHAEHGEPISAARLANRLRVPSADAARLLAALDVDTPPATAPVNGHAVATR